MDIIKVETSSHYDVKVGENILDDCGKLIGEVLPISNAVIISDTTVYALYGDRVKASLEASGYSVLQYCFTPGEDSKTMQTANDIIEFMAEKKISHSDIIVALGGGIVGDVAGFCAAIYLRGISFVQIPTTLLAAVDSSVGGKTGVNLTVGKNLAGAFKQPKLVICDIKTFDTLSEDILKDGLCEVIKYACIMDEDLFSLLENGDYKKHIGEIVSRCVKHKADIVKQDELDKGVRQLLNFGHTIAHAVESLSSYQIPHGRAVAIGMYRIEKANGSSTAQRIKNLLDIYSIPTNCPYTAAELADKASSDKKVRSGKLNLVLLDGIGKAEIVPMEMDKLTNFFDRGL